MTASLDHGQEVGTELLIASGDSSIVLDAVEETFDQVSLAVEGLFPSIPMGPVGLIRNVGYRALVFDLGANPISSRVIQTSNARSLPHSRRRNSGSRPR
jgi:hypothetical protein